MQPIFRQLFKFSGAHLSRRIVFWVFISVIVIEAIILIPSYKKREKELLTQLKELSLAKVTLLMQMIPTDAPARELLERIKGLQFNAAVLGGALYTADGKIVGFFGQRPEFMACGEKPIRMVFNRNTTGDRYDIVYSPAQLKRDYILVLSHNAAPVQRELRAFILRIAGLVIIISIFVTAGAWVALNPIVVTPVLRLREDLEKAGDAISRDQPAPAFYSASVRRKDELGEVIAAFRHMFAQISDAVSKRKRAEAKLQQSLHQVEAYSKALNTEMEKGRQMQTGFLPPELPERAGWEVAAFFKPARQVSGDFYDAFDLPEGNLGLVIADVCDKGVGAALFMALFRSLIRVFSGQTVMEGMACTYSAEAPVEEASVLNGVFEENSAHFDALKAVNFTNKYIAQNHGELAMFATLFFGVLEPQSGVLTYINGGHEPLIVLGADGGVKDHLHPTGPAVGIQSGVNFKLGQIRLEPGEILLGFTDGVTEARATDDGFFGIARLEAMLKTAAPSAAALLDQIAAALQKHTADAEQFDDITLLALQRQRRG